MTLVLSLHACVPRALVEDARDRDDDGHVAWQLGGDDCDDAEPTANPGEEELCGDGVDNDCDEAIDDDGVNSGTWYPDLDNDGYAVDSPTTACIQPTNHRASLDAGIDCDDASGAVHPNAPDTWYDGVDSNCDALDDYDQDGDTYRAPSGGGADCDDLDDLVHPGAAEVCGNHVDDDCDGTHNTCAWSGDLALDATRHATIVWAFPDVTVLRVSVGDTNLDGRDDLLISGLESGDIFLFEGPLSGTLLTSTHPDVHLALPDPPNIFGYGTSLRADLDGDGAAEMMLWNAEDASQNDWPLIYISKPPYRSEMTLDDVSNAINGPDPLVTPSSGFGFTAGSIGDLDGDGVDTFFVTQGGTDPTVCYLLEGMGGGTYMPAIATATLTHCTGGLVGAPDLDGDGTRDVAGPGTDSLVFVAGEPGGSIDLDTAAHLEAWPSVGQRVAPTGYGSFSLDGDTVPDLLVSLPPAAYNGSMPAEVVFGPLVGASASTPRARVDPADGDDAYLVLPPIDVNGDGQTDLVLGHFARDLTTGTGEIAIDVFAGPLTPGTFTRADASARVTLDTEMVLFMTFDTGDIDGDGYGDIVFGGLGVAYVIYGQGR